MVGSRIRVLCALLALLLLFPFASCAREESETLRVTVLDVGQSDCIVISQGEKHMLVDTGSSAARGAVLSYLRMNGIERLEYLLVTHPHEDHFGNSRALLETYSVDRLFLSPAASEELGYALMLDAAAQQEIPLQTVREKVTFSLGNAVCELICPVTDTENVNNASLVLRVTFGECVLLFTGDAESEAEDAILLELGTELVGCDFLKVGHHGSDTASSMTFVQAAAPDIAAISCGKNNEYGFPHRAVLENLAAVGATVYRTDECGNLHFVCDGKEIGYVE